MAGPHGIDVVVVEDDMSMSVAIERLLRIGGCAARMYASAEALLGDPTGQRADCLVLDVQLPGIDGLALYDRLTLRGTPPPAIFITAFADRDCEARAASVGAAFLEKPFSGRMLLDCVRRARTR